MKKQANQLLGELTSNIWPIEKNKQTISRVKLFPTNEGKEPQNKVENRVKQVFIDDGNTSPEFKPSSDEDEGQGC